MSFVLPSRLYAIADDTACGLPLGEQVGILLAAGVKLLQLRSKKLDDAALLPVAREAAARCAEKGAWLLLNDRVALAREAGARGVHLGQGDMDPAAARALSGPDFVIGYSTHDAAEFARGLESPADYLALGPIFPSGTKMARPEWHGSSGLNRFAAKKDRPLVAIGGISRDSLPVLLAAGADGCAVIGAIWREKDPKAAAAALVRAADGPPTLPVL